MAEVGLIRKAQFDGHPGRGLRQPQQTGGLMRPLDLADALVRDAGDPSKVALDRPLIEPLSNPAHRAGDHAIGLQHPTPQHRRRQLLGALEARNLEALRPDSELAVALGRMHGTLHSENETPQLGGDRCARTPEVWADHHFAET
jgi:hypothetical protein